MNQSEPENEGSLSHELSNLVDGVLQLMDEGADAKRDALKYRLLLRNLNVGVFVCTVDGKILECNEGILELWNDTRKGLLGRNLATRYENPNDQARLLASLKAHGFVRNFETWMLQSNGERIATSMNAMLAPIGAGGTQLILGVVEGVEEHKLAAHR